MTKRPQDDATSSEGATAAEDPEQANRMRGAAALRERTARATAKAFDTRTERWQQAGLSAAVDKAESRRAAREAVLLLILLIGVLVLFGFRAELFPELKKVVRYVTAGLLVLIGWGLARTAAKGIAPALLRRMDPATAGTVGFLIRLLTIVTIVFGSLAIAGVKPETLAVGGAFTAVIFGLAAQQTLGNVIAGATLLSARPFRVADRVRVQGSGINVEGTVATLGLFYTTLVSGNDSILLPNSTLMTIAVMPLHEPDPVRLDAKFHSSKVTPVQLQSLLEERISVPLVRNPSIELDEIAADGTPTFVITATPDRSADGATLAADILTAVADVGGESDTDPEGESAATGTREHDLRRQRLDADE